MVKININDIKVPEKRPEDLIGAMFDKQMQLAIKYQDIEKMGNLLKETATNVDTPNGQKWIKDFAWRVTEELCEAEEARIFMNATSKETEEYKEHHKHHLEELIDALHFLIELTIIAGYDKKIVASTNSHSVDDFDIVYNLGLMCNCLKNKPWKQTQMLTDRPKFKKYLASAWTCLMSTFFWEDISLEEIYDLYFKKNAVNQFRIRSKY